MDFGGYFGKHIGRIDVKEGEKMASTETLKERLVIKKKALDAANEAYLALLTGQVKSYAIGSRNLTKFDLPQLEDSIAKLEKEVDALESMINGGKKRKAMGVVPRDF